MENLLAKVTEEQCACEELIEALEGEALGAVFEQLRLIRRLIAKMLAIYWVRCYEST